MKKIFITIVIVTVIVLYVTNPSKVEFVDYAKDNIKDQVDNTIPSASIITGVLNGLAEIYVDSTIESIIDRDNYYLFSVYSVKGLGVDIEGLGVFGKFVVLKFDHADTTKSTSK